MYQQWASFLVLKEEPQALLALRRYPRRTPANPAISPPPGLAGCHNEHRTATDPSSPHPKAVNEKEVMEVGEVAPVTVLGCARTPCGLCWVDALLLRKLVSLYAMEK
ncbi:hypothetical protein SKAU_G00120610 [Synaphobranchus kaupii]|uniref:Uncharacterized protein n=1 Tax=Synaphobranchus kaupii TaxID=118154 RepID=A0A9Q1J2H2_SYNKA|nr:hypothetical protein SKAU_G00120610 [Synaphobranchus kaupii]